MDSSDGEIKDDFSEISEEEYFDSIASKIEKRKLELELLNDIVEIDSYDDFAKENRYENHRNRPSNIINNNINNSIPSSSSKSTFFNRREKTRKNSEIRNQSYRGSSIFSTGIKFSKRRRPRKRRKNSAKAPSPVFLSSSSSSNDEVEVISESDEDELLALRLKALTSKQEVKELIEKKDPSPVMVTPTPSPVESSLQNSNEEEQLRIAALKSALLKKKDDFKKRKQLRKLENERPYSPTDKFEPIVDVEMDLSNSPLNSPFREAICDDINQEIDMDISNSPPAIITLDDNFGESSDMEIVNSPEIKIVDSNDQEEEALRLMLLSSIGNKKKQDDQETAEVGENEVKLEERTGVETEQDISEPSSPPNLLAKNLKMAVERIKQQKQQVPPAIVQQQQKSGTKTIKMILEEQKNKKIIKGVQRETVEVEEDSLKGIPDNQTIIVPEQMEISEERIAEETLLIEKIISADKSLQIVNVSISDKGPLVTESSDSSFSTITDTKNIPLLADSKKSIDNNRLVTSLDSILRPVTPLIISLRESSDDEYDVEDKKKAAKNKLSVNPAAKTANDFEKNLENFLKNIRTQQEKSESPKTALKKVNSTTSANDSQTISPKTSAVKHLPLSSQLEYEKLLQKMKVLQEAKQQKQKSGTLKRTKSSSSNTDKSSQPSQKIASVEPNNKLQKSSSDIPHKISNESEVLAKKSSKIDDTLEKIPLLDEAARGRLIEKTENNYLNHSKNLLESTESNIKLLDESKLDFKRREKIESKIDEMEKSLVKYKNLLRIVNSKIKSNTPKILQSQRDMIKLRNRQFKFGEICLKVGESVRGETYSLPKHETGKIEDNLLKISEKTDEIQKVINEQTYISKQFKLLSNMVKDFVQKSDTHPETSTNKNISNDKNNNDDRKAEKETPKNPNKNGRAIIRTVSQLIATCDNNENEEVHQGEQENTEIEIKEPEIHRNVKRVLENSSNSTESTNLKKKKVKSYESPLEFLKLPASIDGNRKSVNQIVCPFAIEGSCDDRECKYLHL